MEGSVPSRWVATVDRNAGRDPGRLASRTHVASGPAVLRDRWDGGWSSCGHGGRHHATGRGWWWPLAAAGAAIGGAFTLSLVSALRGGRAHEAITRVVAPERAAAAKLERDVQGIRRGVAGHGLLVPVNWDGPVVLSGMQWRGLSPRERRLTSLSVAALERDSPRAERRIEIVHDLEGDSVPLVEQRAEREVDSREWRDGTIIVDGQRRKVRVVEGDGLQAATLRHNGRPVIVIAMDRDLSTLELATTSSVEPLLDEMMRRHSLRMGSSGESTSTSNR